MVKEGEQLNGQSSIGLEHLLEKIYQERGFDFRGYKEGTLTRRLGQRLWARGVKEYDDYARILDQDLGEYELLFDDLTINVTGFFRDDFAFRALEEVVLPKLIEKNTNKHKTLQVWSAACATGEEPYSLAMLLLEMFSPEIDSWKVNIIATDIDIKALNRAEDGYSLSRTTGSVLTRSLKSASLSSFNVCTPKRSILAPVLAWPSARRLSNDMVAGSGSSQSRERAQHFILQLKTRCKNESKRGREKIQG